MSNTIAPCRICDYSNSLQSKWNSETGEKWVHCDECGNASSPSLDDPVQKWNEENSNQNE